MSKCIKTGARVHFEDYGYTRYCDIHEVEGVYVLTSNPPHSRNGDRDDFSEFARLNAEWGLRIGDSFTQNNCAIVVTNKHNLRQKE